MAIKSANVTARVEPDVKERAEEIISRLGLSASTAINMFYRQIIYRNGMPFRPSLPNTGPRALDEMSKEEFDEMMKIGYEQAKADKSSSADLVFDRLRAELEAEING